MAYDWVLFDADDTLLDFRKAARRSFFAVLAQNGIPASDAHHHTFEQANYEVWTAFERGEITTERLRVKRFELFLDRAGLERDAGAMSRLFLDNLVVYTELIPGAREVLSTLALSHRLGIITNGLKEMQRPRLTKTGIIDDFEVIVVSDEIGYAKPDGRFFDVAHRRMGMPARERVLVVGDSLRSDIQGGKAYGFATCWYNPHGKANETAIRPDYEIAGLEAVYDLL